MNSPHPSDDAQRSLEQHALRNVRGLVEKVETLEAADKRTERRMLKGLAIGVAVMVIAFVAAFAWISGKQAGKEVVIDPAKLPPLKGGPPR